MDIRFPVYILVKTILLLWQQGYLAILQAICMMLKLIIRIFPVKVLVQVLLQALLRERLKIAPRMQSYILVLPQVA